MRAAVVEALLSVSLFVSLVTMLAIALFQPGCALFAPSIPMAECDARCGTQKAEDLSRSIAILVCDELVEAGLSDAITLERCYLAATVANSCRSLCR